MDDKPEKVCWTRNMTPEKRKKYNAYRKYLYSVDERYRKKRRTANRAAKEQFIEARKALGCVNCGESRPWVLHFHHVDPTQKRFAIGTARRHLVEEVVEELEKCVVLCANCHLHLHHLERG